MVEHVQADAEGFDAQPVEDRAEVDREGPHGIPQMAGPPKGDERDTVWVRVPKPPKPDEIFFKLSFQRPGSKFTFRFSPKVAP